MNAQFKKQQHCASFKFSRPLIYCRVITLAFLCGIGMISFDASATSHPGMDIVSSPQITDADKATFRANLASDRASATGFAKARVTPETQELARALKYDANLIYEYVRNNIELDIVKGLIRNATATIISGRGTAFDQANLMVELLRLADSAGGMNYSPRFVMGEVQVNTATFDNWFVVPGSAQAVEQTLLNRGHWVTRNTSTITFDHVWVRFNIGGVAHDVDPSYKEYNVIAGANLAAELASAGYSRSGFLSGALQGASYTPGEKIQGVNDASIESELVNISSNLISNIATGNPDAVLEHIIGGQVIVPDQRAVSDVDLPYAPGANAAEYVEIPNTDRIFLSIAHKAYDAAGASLGTISASGRPDYTYGQRIVVDNRSGVSFTFGKESKIKIASSFPADATFVLEYTPVFPIYRAFLNVGTLQQPIRRGLYYVVNSWGEESSQKWVVHHKKMLLEQQNQIGAMPSDIEATEMSLAIAASNYLVQFGALRKLQNTASGVNVMPQRLLGLAGYENSVFIDLPHVSLTAVDNVTGAFSEDGFLSQTGYMSVFESATWKQSLRVDAVSSVALIDLLNSQNKIFYDANQSSWSTVKPQLVNWNAADLTDIGNNIADGSARWVLNENQSLTVGEWTGTSSIRFGYNAAGQVNIASYMIGNLKGGFPTVLVSGDDFTLTIVDSLDDTYTYWSSDLSIDPIYLPSGDFYLSHDDITVGQGQHPQALGFTRTYNSDQTLETKSLGRGWSHNFSYTAREDSDPAQGLGIDSAIDALPTVVATYITRDLLSASQELDHFITASLVQSWLADNLTNNVVDVEGPNSVERFVRLPDGTYNPPPGSASSLSQTTDGSYQYRTKDGTTLDFNLDGNIEQWRDLAGITVNFSYTGDKLNSVSNSFGRQLNFSYNAKGFITSVDDGAGGRSVSYSYDADDNLINFTDPKNNASVYGYAADSPGLMTTIKYPANPTNNFVTNVYDALGRVKEQYNAHGQKYEYFYANGYRTEEIDPAGNPQVWYFNEEGQTTRAIDRLGRETTSEYDNHERLVKRTFPEGNAVTQEYDTNHNVIKATQLSKPCGGGGCTALPPISAEFSYRSSDNRMLWSQDADGNRTDYTYNSAGQITEVRAPAPTSGSARPTTLVQNYNSCGMPQRVVNPDGVTREVTYDASCNPTQSILIGDGAAQFITTYTYDAIGNRISQKDPETGAVTTFQYDPNRNVVRVDAPATPEAAHSISTYDAENRVIEQAAWNNTSGSYVVTTQQYSVSGQVVSTTDADGNTTTNYYDVIDRLERIVDPLGRETKTVYDAAGQVLAVRRAVGTALEQAYRTNTWSDNSKLTSVTDANNNTTTYGYDALDRLVLTTMPDGTTVQQLNLDARGNVGTIVNREGQSTLLSYDKLNRVTFKNAPSEADVSYAYDLGGKPTVISDTDGNSYTYSYDAAGRATSITDHNGRVVSYNYDKASKLTQVTYPGADNFYLSYSYDSLNRLIGIREGDPTTGTLLAAYTYNSLSQRQTLQINGNVAAVAYGQDQLGRLTDLGYGLDPANTTLDIGYDYDAASQQTRRFYSDGNYAWQDSAANPAVVTGYGAANNLNQYGSATVSGGVSQTINYDLNGNLTGYNGSSYSYDSQNRLVQALTPTHTLDYGYNPQGQRIRKTSTPSGGSASVTHYFHSGSHEIAEYTGTALKARYIYGPGTDEILAQIDYSGSAGSEAETSRRFFYSDGLGSVIATLDETGAVTKKYRYSPFGIHADTNDHSDQPWGYTGQRYDADSGLYYYKARYYHPSLGRFLSVDPVGYDDQMNLYAYVANRPMMFRDPSGRWLTSATNTASDAWDITKEAIYDFSETVSLGWESVGVSIFKLNPGVDSSFEADLIEHYFYGDGADYYISDYDWQQIQFGITDEDNSYFDQGIGAFNPGTNGSIDSYDFYPLIGDRSYGATGLQGVVNNYINNTFNISGFIVGTVYGGNDFEIYPPN